MSRNYVKSTIESGTENENKMTISAGKAANATSYTVSGIALPKNAAKYFHCTQPGTVMSLPYCYTGSGTKIAEFDFIEISINGIIDAGYASPANQNLTFKCEILRANYTSATTISTNSYAYSKIVPADSADSAASVEVKLDAIGLTNQEILFSGYFKCESNSTSTFMQNKTYKIPLGREAGRPINLIDNTQTLIARFSGANANYLLGNIFTSWYEY